MLGGQRVNRNRPLADQGQRQFDSLRASLLFCPRCQVATPTRERLLLVLPSGNLYEYLCAHCGTSTGSKTENPVKPIEIIGP
ncbi:MAG: cytoplasmic protein [Nitrospira sp. WS110]|nr:cytoplasmic protein [Nitrospira sp. WS110]